MLRYSALRRVIDFSFHVGAMTFRRDEMLGVVRSEMLGLKSHELELLGRAARSGRLDSRLVVLSCLVAP